MEDLCVSASRPVDFGICGGGKSVYQLLSWIDGEDAETLLPVLSEKEQYALGIRSGEILKKIHSIPASDTQEDWAIPYGQDDVDIMLKQSQDNAESRADLVHGMST